MLKEYLICISNMLCNYDYNTPLCTRFIDADTDQGAILIDAMNKQETKKICTIKIGSQENIPLLTVD